MNEIESGLHRVEVGRLKVLEAVNRKLYRVEIWALNDRVNRNGWKYINLESHLPEFQNIPILTAYLRDGKVIGDGHNFDMRIDPKTGEQYASFTGADSERIVGWIPKDANIRIEPEGDTKWVVVTGYLWTWYSRELVEKIAGQGGGMEVSIETLVTKEHKENGYDVEESYSVLGITVLGDGVSPAVAGASIKSLAELRSSMKDEILKAASYIGEKEPETQKTTNPKERKKITMIPTMRQLAEAGKAFEGYTCVGLSEDGMRVALLSADHAPFFYAFSETDKGNVIPERIKAASAIVTFKADEMETEASLDTVMAPALNSLNAAEKRVKDLEANVQSLTEKLEGMEKREKARRLQAAKDAAKAALDKFNANRDEDRKFNCDILEGLNSRIDAGEFTDCEDKECCWIGDKMVANEVAVLCMAEQAKQDAAAKAKEKHFHTWNQGAKNNAASQVLTMADKLRADAAAKE
ncbi:MAG: hypothetical protein IKE04_04015 [Oscillospiraceae bacterium]|nr:hypothetical protein [Oscillospiraceae bacterium]